MPSTCYIHHMPSSKDRAAKALGEFIRTQRRLADLSIRELSRMTRVSNPYLSQIERGIYRPSANVLKAIAQALDISAESLYAKVGLVEEDPDRDVAHGVEEAIRMDGRLTTEQKDTLLGVYRSFVREEGPARRGA